jgi:hypothetical protein
MHDLTMAALVVVFFALAVAYARFCDRVLDLPQTKTSRHDGNRLA